MKTKAQGNELVEIRGHINLGREDRPLITDKAFSVTIDSVDGCQVNQDSKWLAKSIMGRHAWREVREHGVVVYEFSAEVPAWWARKLDTRPEWQRRGYARPPSPVRM